MCLASPLMVPWRHSLFACTKIPLKKSRATGHESFTGLYGPVNQAMIRARSLSASKPLERSLKLP